MTKPLAQQVAEADEAAGLSAMPGQSLHHDLQLDLAAWTGWNDVAAVLARQGAEVQSVRLQRSGDSFAGRCRFTGPGAAEARALVVGLIEGGLVRSARVEHLILKTNETVS